MPFITEEIYTKLYDVDESIMISSFSDYSDKDIFEEEENLVETFKNITHPSKKSKLIFVSEKYKREIKNSEGFLLKLGYGNSLEVKDRKENISDNVISILNNGIELYIPSEDLIDIKEEIERLQTEKKKLEAEVLRGEKMLSNEGFISKAPGEKINEEKNKLANYKEKLTSVIERLEKLK